MKMNAVLLMCALWLGPMASAAHAERAPKSPDGDGAVDANPVERALRARFVPSVSLAVAWAILSEPQARGASLSVMARLSWPLEHALPRHIAPSPVEPLRKASFYELLDRLEADADRDDRADVGQP